MKYMLAFWFLLRNCRAVFINTATKLLVECFWYLLILEINNYLVAWSAFYKYLASDIWDKCTCWIPEHHGGRLKGLDKGPGFALEVEDGNNPWRGIAVASKPYEWVLPSHLARIGCVIGRCWPGCDLFGAWIQDIITAWGWWEVYLAVIDTIRLAIGVAIDEWWPAVIGGCVRIALCPSSSASQDLLAK